MMTSGAHVPAKECLAMGLVDELAPEGKLKETAIAFARKVIAECRWCACATTTALQAAKGHPEIFANSRVNARKFRGFKAPEANINASSAVNRRSMKAQDRAPSVRRSDVELRVRGAALLLRRAPTTRFGCRTIRRQSR
jgi:enoyl-CoA hydratase/carnithine racemase